MSVKKLLLAFSLLSLAAAVTAYISWTYNFLPSSQEDWNHWQHAIEIAWRVITISTAVSIVTSVGFALWPPARCTLENRPAGPPSPRLGDRLKVGLHLINAPSRSPRIADDHRVNDLRAHGRRVKNCRLLRCPNIGLVGSGGKADVENLLAATFQAQPFAEPFTRKFYVRERWYDPHTGTWLTSDTIGYKDSANLYAFCGGDPINHRDPLGHGEEQSFRAGMALSQDPHVQAGMSRFARRIGRFGKHQGKNLVGLAYMLDIAHQCGATPSNPAKCVELHQLVAAAKQTKNAAANWGTSAGELIDNPDLI
jgi:RHS repeat-associated protein